MNEMNELETQLRSWAPRRPSARISEALFGRGAVARLRRERELKASHSSAFLLNWLAPAVAAVALMFAFFHVPSNSTVVNRSPVSPVFAVILSNQSLGPILLEASNREPASPASLRRSIDINGLGVQPKSFGVATSGVSTGASERLPDWPSQPQMEERDNPATNGARLAPQAGVRVDLGSRVRFCHQSQQESIGLIVAGKLCPGGTAENSSAFQRWVGDDRSVASPEGTADSSARSLGRPIGADAVSTSGPTLRRWSVATHSSGTKESARSYTSGDTRADTILVSPRSRHATLC